MERKIDQLGISKRITKAIFAVMLFSFVLSSCKKKDEASALPQPLQTMVSSVDNCICDPFIDKYSWEGQTVYVQSGRAPDCDMMTRYFDDEGEEIFVEEKILFSDFEKKATFLKNVWTCTK